MTADRPPEALSDEARRQHNLAVLNRLGQGAYGSSLSTADITDALAAGRAERDSGLGIASEAAE